MKNRISIELCLQIIILTACAVVLIATQSKLFVQAQINCPGPDFYGSVPSFQNAWSPITDVIVKIDDRWNSTERAAIKTGLDGWEGTVPTQSCSNVTFKDPVTITFDPAMIEDESSYPPISDPPTTYVVKVSTSGTLGSNDVRTKNGIQHHVRIRLDPSINSSAAFTHITVHEMGHCFGLRNCNASQCYLSSVMGSYYEPNTSAKACDVQKLRELYCPATPTPTPTPTPPVVTCDMYVDYSIYTHGCPSGRRVQGDCCVCDQSQATINFCFQNGGEYDPNSCNCTGGCGDWGCSPIVVDVLGNGFSLTNVANGVRFDLGNRGTRTRCAWTSPNSDDAWLALDRNRNGVIDSGLELFGNVTGQDPRAGEERNGFIALAAFDKVMNGGNNDGLITRHDLIFDRLRLWQDANQNGISEAGELKTLEEVGLRKLELDYRKSRRVDAHGNQFKFRAKVKDTQDAQLGRWAWDVFLVTEP